MYLYEKPKYMGGQKRAKVDVFLGHWFIILVFSNRALLWSPCISFSFVFSYFFFIFSFFSFRCNIFVEVNQMIHNVGTLNKTLYTRLIDHAGFSGTRETETELKIFMEWRGDGCECAFHSYVVIYCIFSFKYNILPFATETIFNSIAESDRLPKLEVTA